MNCNIFLIIIQVYGVCCQLNTSTQTHIITEYTSGDVLNDIQVTPEFASGETWEVSDSNYSDTPSQTFQNCFMNLFTDSQFFQKEYHCSPFLSHHHPN